MTGARAAMSRVFEEREPQALDADQVTALTALAERVRELAEAVIMTDVDGDEAAAVAEQVAALTERLNAARRGTPPGVGMDASGAIQQLGSPVTGDINAIAPPIRFTQSPDGTARSEFTLNVLYEGPPGFVHGGMAAMILDHLCGSAAAANGTPGMTAGLDMRYRRPTPYGVPLVAEAKVVRVDGRKTFVESRIIGPDGHTTAEATAVFVMPTA